MASAGTTAKSATLVEGVVAAILNERELVLNKGYADGVERGMKFRVLAAPFEVIDPETDKSLGFIDRDKTRVEAINVQERMSVCRTYRSVGGLTNSWNDMLSAAMADQVAYAGKSETFKADESSHVQTLDEDESYVKIGDKVVQLPPNE
jgi:hypothetical protein